MGLFRISALLVLFASSCLATYGHNDNHGYGKGGSRDIHLDTANIHLDSPKIVVDRPRIHIKDESGHVLSHAHGHVAVHSTPKAVAPIVINGGHGGYGAYGGYEGHGGKVLNVAGPVIHHEGPVLVRRPVTVHKELIPTQDHLENLHHFNLGGLHHGGYVSAGHALGHGIGGYHGLAAHGGFYGAGHGLGHGGYVQALPLSKGHHHHEKAVVYERPLTNLGHGHITFSAYHQPATPVIVAQPRPIYAGHIHGGHIHGGHIHAGGLYGGGIALGNHIHGGLQGGHGAYKKY